MTPPPPTPTLFPYTTLFRSQRVGEQHEQDRQEQHDEQLQHEARAEQLREHHGHAEQDRKSTRLNSSHLGISYAVFCLKKKKHNEDDNECMKVAKRKH